MQIRRLNFTVIVKSSFYKNESIRSFRPNLLANGVVQTLFISKNIIQNIYEIHHLIDCVV